MKQKFKKDRLIKFKLWSNIFFVFPLLLSIIKSLHLYSLIIGIMLLLSINYHYNDERKYFYRDCFVSIMLMASNFWLLINGGWLLPYSFIALSCATIAIYYYSKQYKHGYDYNHGMWHFFSAIVCYFSILTFLS